MLIETGRGGAGAVRSSLRLYYVSRSGKHLSVIPLPRTDDIMYAHYLTSIPRLCRDVVWHLSVVRPDVVVPASGERASMTEREPPSFGSYRPQPEGAQSTSGLQPGPRPGQPPFRHPATPRRSLGQRLEPPGRGGLLRWVLVASLGVAGLLIATVAVLLAVAPTGLIRDQMIAEVKAATGRDLVVNGQTTLSLFPSIAVSMHDVQLSAPPGMTGPPSVRIERLQADIPLVPLMRREMRIDRLVLTKPVFELRIDESGRRSWDFALNKTLSPGDRIRYAQAATVRNDASGGVPRAISNDASALSDIALGDIRIVDGRVRYVDDRFGTVDEARSLNVSVSGNKLVDPLAVKGNLMWRGDRVAFNADIASPRSLISGQPAAAKLQLSSATLNVGLNGNVRMGSDVTFDGQVNAESQSARALAAWVGGKLPAVNGFGPLKFAGQLTVRPDMATLKSAKLAFDKSTAAGDVAVQFKGPRPMVTATLSLDVLDLNDYLSSEIEASSDSTTGAGNGAPNASKPAVNSIDDLLRGNGQAAEPGRFKPQVRGYTRRDDWSDVPIDLLILHTIDAEVKLSTAQLFFHDMKVGRATVDARLKNAVMQAHLREMALYDGQGTGQVRIDASGAVPQVAAAFGLNGLTALHFLKDATGLDWIEGKAKVQLSVTAQGPSQKAMVSALDGKASVALADGAIIGYDLGEMVSGVQDGRLPSFERDTAKKTSYSSLTVSYQIANGIASSKDLKLVSPLLGATGEGTVSLPDQQIDYVVRPKITAAGTNGQEDASLEIPINIKGHWANPTITPDLNVVVKNPSAAINAIKKFGERFKGQKGIGDVLNQIFGK